MNLKTLDSPDVHPLPNPQPHKSPNPELNPEPLLRPYPSLNAKELAPRSSQIVRGCAPIAGLLLGSLHLTLVAGAGVSIAFGLKASLQRFP